MQSIYLDYLGVGRRRKLQLATLSSFQPYKDGLVDVGYIDSFISGAGGRVGVREPGRQPAEGTGTCHSVGQEYSPHPSPKGCLKVAGLFYSDLG